MSDLQCPTTFWLVPADVEAAVIARALAHERVAEVRGTPCPDAAVVARRLATAWGLPEPAGTDLDATSYPAVLADLADTRRGETVVIVVDRALIRVVLGDVDGGDGAGSDPVAVEADADGCRIRGRRPVR